MLEQYLASREAADADAELPTSVDAPIPTRAEDVDRFMAELVRASRPHTTHAVNRLILTRVCALTFYLHRRERGRRRDEFARARGEP